MHEGTKSGFTKIISVQALPGYHSSSSWLAQYVCKFLSPFPTSISGSLFKDSNILKRNLPHLGCHGKRQRRPSLNYARMREGICVYKRSMYVCVCVCLGNVSFRKVISKSSLLSKVLKLPAQRYISCLDIEGATRLKKLLPKFLLILIHRKVQDL